LSHRLLFMRSQLDVLSSIVACLACAWPVLLVGSASYSSKTTLVQILAALCGRPLNTFELNSSIDTNELLGTYEQLNWQQFVKHQLNACKDKYLSDDVDALDEKLDWSERDVTVDDLHRLKDVFPADEMDKLLGTVGHEQHFV
jgi:midasin (ATPase involved in ribosome maturation)